VSFETGLKEASKDIASMFGISHESLYAEQRRLMSAGLISRRPGRGPNSGAEASPENLALLVASYFGSQPMCHLADALRHAKTRASK
jgi:hypothetical protein